MKTVEKKKTQQRIVSLTTIIIAAFIIVIGANGMVWKNRIAKSAEIDSLTSQVNQVTQSINKAPAPPTDLDVKLTMAMEKLTAAQTALPAEFNRNDIIDYIITLAKDCQVEILPIASQGWTEEKTGQSYPVLKLTTTVTGSFTQANEFISKLQNGNYKTLWVPEINISRNSPADNTGAFSGDNTAVTVRLVISIYARPSTADKGVK